LYLKRDFVSELSSGQQALERQKVQDFASWHAVANVVAQALIFISSCCNPFIYYITSRNFREYILSFC